MTDTELAPLLRDALRDLQYGTVQFVVHEGRVVRIERIERIRLPSQEDVPKPTGPTGG
jgi:hypothetical protein